jgi:hypothetical protein
MIIIREVQNMQCARCQDVIPEGEECNFHGQMLCEDCYIGAVQPPKTCDVAAVHAAKKHREGAGQTGTDGLTQLQKDIYNFIEQQGKVTKEQLGKQFELPPWELEREFSVLRHCELVKAQKQDEKIFLTLFNTTAQDKNNNGQKDHLPL